MQAHRKPSCGVSFAAFAFAWLMSVNASAQDPNHDIRVLSNRADLISGGDALVEIIVPPGIVQAMLNGNQKIKAALDSGPLPDNIFAVRPDGRVLGLVTGLKIGQNTLTVQTPGKTMSIVITNHPIGGPVFSGGAQLQPWICATSASKSVTVVAPRDPSLSGVTATRVSGLSSDPIDGQCDTPSQFFYYYYPAAKVGTGCTLTITGTNPCFVAYDPASRPSDADIADFTNDRGDTVKSMVRLEKGTINRVIYQVLSYFDPAKPWQPWAPQLGWNGKLMWKMGASTSANHFEAAPSATSIFDQNALSAGFMTANSSSTEHSQNNNELLAAETMMMVKEHIIETYGEIRYTMSDGGSGGSMMQTNIATIVPGLLDGIQPSSSYPDAVSTWIETMDCGLLRANYFLTLNGSALTEAQKAAITGHPNAAAGGGAYCNTWVVSFLNPQRPDLANNCGLGFPAGIVYDAALRPRGVRCSIHDIQAPQWGEFTDSDGNIKTKLPYDNVGVQYGLGALQGGAITAEQFVQLNEGIGSYSNDLAWSGGSVATPTIPAARHAAQADVLPTIYSSGILADGRQLAKVPIIDIRPDLQVPNIHMPWRSWSERDRLDRANGTHENQVIRAFFRGAGGSAGVAGVKQAFFMMDRWLAAIESDDSSTPLEEKVILNRPADVHDACFNTPGDTDAQVDASQDVGLDSPACLIKHAASPHVAAGGPLAENVFKCQLKPLNLSDTDYQGIAFNPGQAARLAAVFPSGVCDWTKLGIAQTNAVPTTFVDGPGGKPLPRPPVAIH
jgi:Tannase-like family of unknown function (DUF6351)